LPAKGEKLFQGGKQVGYVTSAVASPKFHGNIGLGYVRREAGGIGNELELHLGDTISGVRIVALPFRENFS
jgi:glycine cleavage system aminomethyltransferase T